MKSNLGFLNVTSTVGHINISQIYENTWLILKFTKPRPSETWNATFMHHWFNSPKVSSRFTPFRPFQETAKFIKCRHCNIRETESGNFAVDFNTYEIQLTALQSSSVWRQVCRFKDWARERWTSSFNWNNNENCRKRSLEIHSSKLLFKKCSNDNIINIFIYIVMWVFSFQ